MNDDIDVQDIIKSSKNLSSGSAIKKEDLLICNFSASS